MSWTRRLINSIRPAATVKRPTPGRLIRPRAEDTWRDYPSSGLTPSRLMAILRQADAGDPSLTMQLFEEMEEKDAHLYAVANTRRLALTGLEWQVISAADLREGVDRTSADEAAAYCREVLIGIDALDEALQFLSLALGRNIAVAELVWDRVGPEMRIVDVAPVDFTRIVFDDLDRPRILTKEQPRDGIEAAVGKFVVHCPHAVSAHPSRGGLLRVTAMVYLAKNLALKDWMIFTEVFGMPVRIARYDSSATDEEKRELLHMLESLGSNAAGVFSKSIELEVVEANRGTVPPPYEKLVDFLNREMSKAWLGQTLTTETSGLSGVYTATRIHEKVRKDIRADDMRKEGRTIRSGVLAPLTQMKFGPAAPVPFFRRVPADPAGTEELVGVLDTAVNRLGVRVPLRWAHDALGIPQAGDGDDVVRGATD
ncbi:MAG: DUF935 family protein [Phycisphaerales bacterium]|nr:MAG: DUF935 family protein [Phycisphaerales bacterium]